MYITPFYNSTKKTFYIRQPFKETIDESGSSFGGQELGFEGRGQVSGVRE